MKVEDYALLALWHTKLLKASVILAYLRRQPRETMSVFLETQTEKGIALPEFDKLVEDGRHILEQYERFQAHPLFFNDPDFPKALQLGHPPFPILILQGNRELLQTRQLAIVGSRQIGETTSLVCNKICNETIERGFIITSGGALGVDACAHRCCMRMKAPTILVAATGIDQQYPAENKDIYAYCRTNGVVISPFPLFTPPTRFLFPSRNTIIAALAETTIVMQARKGSGALYTAEAAIRMGKRVLVVAGEALQENFEGGMELVKNGKAQLLTQLTDLPNANLNKCGFLQKEFVFTEDSAPVLNNTCISNAEYDPFTQKVLDRLLAGVNTRERLAEFFDDYAKLNEALLTLELDGVIWRGFGDAYEVKMQ